MIELLINMGHLIALKQLNRDKVAASLGMTRQNLIASAKGRRPLPNQYLLPLCKILCLDDSYLLKAAYVHTLAVSNATKQYEVCYAIMNNFLVAPLKPIALLHGIGETQHAFAFILHDSRGVHVLLRNDEKTLALIESSNFNAGSTNGTKYTDGVEDIKGVSITDDTDSDNLIDLSKGIAGADTTNHRKLFCNSIYPIEREITITHFERIVREGITVEALNKVLKQDIKVWTWSRLCEKAESSGISPDEIAKKLKWDI